MNYPLVLNHSALHGMLLILLWLCLPAGAMADPCTKTVATAISVQGEVETRSTSNAKWKKITAQDTFCTGDMVRTQTNSRAALYLINNSILRLSELSTVTFTNLSSQNASSLDLKKGIAHFISRIKQRFEVMTPYVNAVVDGTEFVVAVDTGQTGAGQTRVTVLEGQVRANNELGEVSLNQGETALTRAGKAPVLSTRVRPWDAVSWALHYPVVTDIPTLTDTALPAPWNARFAQSIDHYRQGNLSAALAALESLPDHPVLTDIPPGIYRYRATLYLAAGQASLASADLEQALKLDTEDGNAFALKAIIAVVQNQTDLAVKLARQAVETSPDTHAPWLAQSYAQQAVFDLEQARLSVETAVKLAPKSALAWARLAELHLMFGQLDQALQAAQHAADIAPELARAQSVLGFVHLTRIDTTAAEQAFNQAIKLDQADPLPRLGSGLTKIRKGQLKDGTRAIETAAIVDPTNSLIRSYLGKAYYEQGREKLAAAEFAIAKELDAKDPTPYFYNAILHQTTNRPVDALENLQRSITLNDQRAVYRSRLLLDQDRATRGANLSRVYSDLGMEQVALAEGWKSVAIAPSNYSAHRFLADAYSARPRHEIARVSELLQAQLLQPINITPVKARLGATYINPGTGFENAGMNEYTPLFERNQTRLFTSAIIGNDGILGDELTISGLHDRLSFSLGQYYSKTDGFRENNDERNSLYNVFAQFAATPGLNIQMEYRRRDTRRGDLEFKFDPDDFDASRRSNIEQEDIRIGGHFVMSPKSRIVANVTDVDRDVKTAEPVDGTDRLRFDNEQGYQIELQHLFQSRQYNVVTGLGRYNVETERRNTLDLVESLCLIIACVINANDATRKHDNIYAYINITRPAKVVWTLGLAYDDYEIVNQNRQNKFNPKLGVQWDINDTIRLRAAAFKTFKRALAVNQTIEPTQVAGFNQFFDDPNATTSTRYGLGLDFRWTRNIYSGLEYTQRNLKIPTTGFDLNNFTDQDRDEYFHRAYLYWTPTKNIAVNVEYQYEKFDRKEGDLRKSETHILPLTMRYFSAQAFFGELGANYVHQNLDGGPSTSVSNNNDAFLQIDATIGYRLPKIRGSISFSVRNLFNEDFNYYDINPWVSERVQPRFTPGRYIFSHLTIHL